MAFVESAQNLAPEKCQCGRQAQHVTVSHPFGGRARSCLTLAFERECSCSAPPCVCVCVLTKCSVT